MRCSKLILSVKGLKIGQEVRFAGKWRRIVGFPTRSSVILETIDTNSGEWSRAKVQLREILPLTKSPKLVREEIVR